MCWVAVAIQGLLGEEAVEGCATRPFASVGWALPPAGHCRAGDPTALEGRDGPGAGKGCAEGHCGHPEVLERVQVSGVKVAESIS